MIVGPPVGGDDPGHQRMPYHIPLGESRDTDAVDSQLEEFIASGPREIIVHRADLEAARALVGEDAG